MSGKKLSKSDDDTLERRNKSYEKVLDAQIAYVSAMQNFDENAGELGVRWMNKWKWHEKEFGW